MKRLELDPDRTAVVVMDFQIGIVGNASDPDGTVDRAGAVLAAARAAGAHVIHVMHRGGRFEADSPDVEIHPGVTPIAGETVLRKIRAGSFSSTGLDALLREDGRDPLVDPRDDPVQVQLYVVLLGPDHRPPMRRSFAWFFRSRPRLRSIFSRQ